MSRPEATIVCDSMSEQGKRLTTKRVKLHRFILAELNTHRMLSRNYRSSRAVPTKKLIQEVRTTPAMPIYWGRNQKGMQAVEEWAEELSFKAPLLDEYQHWRWVKQNIAREQAWTEAAMRAAEIAEAFDSAGYHKQLVNRLLEPFLWSYGVLTATEWDNFFGLRLHKDAQPEMRALAIAMWEARKASTPTLTKPGEWHLPFITLEDGGDVAETDGPACRQAARDLDVPLMDILIKISVARCARVSYESFETGKRSKVEEDLKLYDRLTSGLNDSTQPLHASPMEHQGTPDEPFSTTHDLTTGAEEIGLWQCQEQHGNFQGWRQYRKMLPNESIAPLPEEYR